MKTLRIGWPNGDWFELTTFGWLIWAVRWYLAWFTWLTAARVVVIEAAA